MASMRKKGKGGHYYARFYDPNRRPRQKTVALKTTRKDVARRRLASLEERYEKGQYDPWAPDDRGPEHLTVQQGIERFLKAKSHLRQRTLETYKELLEKWNDRHCPAGLGLKDVRVKHLKGYVYDASVSRASQRKRYRHVRALLNWTVQAGLIERSPLENVSQPKAEPKEPEYLTVQQVERLLETIEWHVENVMDATGRVSDVQWLMDMVRVGISTGLRRQELLALRWSDLDLENGFMRVSNRGEHRTKSGAERTIPLAGDAFDVLRRLDMERADDLDGPVFTDRRGLPIKKDRVSKRFKFFVRKAKLKGRERLRFHSLRHSCASWLAMQGVPQRVIQGVLGHKQSSTTEIYMHLQPEAMTQAMEKTFGGGLGG